jgi:maltose-binding protein MalE
MRRFTVFIVSLLSATLLLSACGDNNQNQPAATGDKTLVVWLDTARAKALAPLVQRLAQQQGVRVRLQEFAFNDLRDQFKLAAPTGEGPDIMLGANDWIGELIYNGMLDPIELGDKEKSFDEVSIRAFTYNQRTYGLPYSTEAIALMYNKDLVPTPPATWDELKQIAKRLQDEGKVQQGYVLQEADPYHTYPLFTGFGGYVFGKTTEGDYTPRDVGLDSAGSVAAVNELDSMIKSGLLRNGIDSEAMQDRFRKKQTAMIITGPWTVGSAKTAGVNFGVAPLPKAKEQMRPFVGVQGFMLSSFSKNKLLAKTFLTEFMATDETMWAFYEADPRFPAWRPIQERTSPEIKAFGESVKMGEPLPSLPQMTAVWDSWKKGLTLIFNQQVAPERAMKDAADTIRAKIQR